MLLPIQESLSQAAKASSVQFWQLNIYQRKFQQWITNQNSMIHATNVVILHIDTDGSDVSRAVHLQTMLEMHGLQSKVTIKDIMPSDEDNELLCIGQISISGFLIKLVLTL